MALWLHLDYLCVSHSVVSNPLQPYGLPGSSVHGCPRQEYWSECPFPSPGKLLYPGIKPGSPALQAGPLPSEPSGEIMESEETVDTIVLYLDWGSYATD